MARFRTIHHQERLPVVEHLDELRTRIIVSLAVFGVAFALCFWQNHLLLEIANGPLPAGRVPITFGVSEAFTTTLVVSAYAAIVISLPVILHQIYAYVLPALGDRERRVAFPLLMMIPILFIAGVTFAYLVVLPAAIKFLLNFNHDQFNVQVRAKDYYGFFTTTSIAIGLVFQVPVGILAATRIGLVTPAKLRRNRRYAYVVIAIVAAALPGTDPVSMLFEMVPMVLLYEFGIVLAHFFGRRASSLSEPASVEEQ